MIILSQFHVLLLLTTVIAVFYIGFIVGNYDRRMPKVDNEDAIWWHTAEGSEAEAQIFEHIKKINEKQTASGDSEPLPF